MGPVIMDRWRVLLVATLSLLSLAVHADQRPSGQGPETYRGAVVDADGRLVITAIDGRTIVLAKGPGQRSWGTPLLSDDRQALGVQELHPNCCTSYDLPLALVVFSGGTAHRFTGNGLPIFRWHFADRGRRVAYGQEPAHSGCAVHYELREIASGRLIDSADVPQPCAEHQSPSAGDVPDWVSALRAGR
jgi:hypothetical protein